jgi:hypothetical protein
MKNDNDDQGGIVVLEGGKIELLNRSEIEQQITTAKRFPRVLSDFRTSAKAMVTMTQEIADSCIFALPRMEKGERKTIEGPSIRFAEMLVSCWGNCRVASRLVDIGERHLTAVGVFHDLQSNSATSKETQRSIWGNYGRYRDDMIMVTANAAGSIALRNAIIAGIPQSIWQDIYDAARRTAIGEGEAFIAVRDKALRLCAKAGAALPVVLALFGRNDVPDISGADVLSIKGLLSAIREGETTVEEAFNMKGGVGANEPAVDSGEPRSKSAQAKVEAAAEKIAEAPTAKVEPAKDEAHPDAAAQTAQLHKAEPVREADAVEQLTLASFLIGVDKAKKRDDLVDIDTRAPEHLGNRELAVLRAAITKRFADLNAKDEPSSDVEKAEVPQSHLELDTSPDPSSFYGDDISEAQQDAVEKKLRTVNAIAFWEQFKPLTLNNIGKALMWLRDNKAAQ